MTRVTPWDYVCIFKSPGKGERNSVSWFSAALAGASIIFDAKPTFSPWAIFGRHSVLHSA
jgi:hypothetical protein